MRESTVESYLRKRMRAIGGECPKWVSPGRRGVHDRICFFPNGVVVFVETKSPTGKLRPEQRRWHRRVAELRAHQRVAHTKAQVDELVAWFGAGHRATDPPTDDRRRRRETALERHKR